MKKITILITLLMLSFSFNYAQSTLLIDRSKEGQSTTSPKAESTKTVTPEKTQAKKNHHPFAG